MRQVKVMVAALDPLGLPVATGVVAGNQADDPLYVPAIKRVLGLITEAVLLFVGDCKMSALATSACLQSSPPSRAAVVPFQRQFGPQRSGRPGNRERPVDSSAVPRRGQLLWLRPSCAVDSSHPAVKFIRPDGAGRACTVP